MHTTIACTAASAVVPYNTNRSITPSVPGDAQMASLHASVALECAYVLAQLGNTTGPISALSGDALGVPADWPLPCSLALDSIANSRPSLSRVEVG